MGVSLGLHLLVLMQFGAPELKASSADVGNSPLLLTRVLQRSAPVVEAAEAMAAPAPRLSPPTLAPSPASAALAAVAPRPPQGVEPVAEAPFLVRSQLSQGPEPLSSVQLLWPSAGPQDGEFSTVLSLFIDEQGQVLRVRVDGAPLPPAMEAVAVQAFLATRFKPGERDGQAVRTRLRVAVNFDAGLRVESRGALRH